MSFHQHHLAATDSPRRVLSELGALRSVFTLDGLSKADDPVLLSTFEGVDNVDREAYLNIAAALHLIASIVDRTDRGSPAVLTENDMVLARTAGRVADFYLAQISKNAMEHCVNNCQELNADLLTHASSDDAITFQGLFNVASAVNNMRAQGFTIPTDVPVKDIETMRSSLPDNILEHF